MSDDNAPSLPPTTTAQQDLTKSGQRRVNMVWELTQAAVALMVTASTLYVSAALALNESSQVAAFLLLSNAFFLIIGAYFSRTNHQSIGGIGPKDNEGQEYRGR